MNMLTTIPRQDSAAAIWADACRDRAAIVRNPRGFIRLAEMLSRFGRNDVEVAIDMLIDTLDRIDGDIDAEQIDEREPCDEGDRWRGQPHGEPIGEHEDDEDDDPAGGNIEDKLQGSSWNEVVSQVDLGWGDTEDDELPLSWSEYGRRAIAA
jgi:hypothetical protein